MARYLQLPAQRVRESQTIDLGHDGLLADTKFEGGNTARVTFKRALSTTPGGKQQTEKVGAPVTFTLSSDGQWFRGEQPQEIYTLIMKPAAPPSDKGGRGNKKR